MTFPTTFKRCTCIILIVIHNCGGIYHLMYPSQVELWMCVKATTVPTFQSKWALIQVECIPLDPILLQVLHRNHCK